MTATAADLLAQAKDDYLASGLQERRNKLAAPYTAGQNTLIFQYDLGGIAQGASLSIGLNTFYVWSVDSPNKTAIVQGGYQGSVDAHADAGDAVTVTPRYADFRIFRALNQTLAALSSPATGLFQVKQADFTYDGSLSGYPLAGVSSVLSIAEIRYATPGFDQRQSRLPRSSYRLDRTEGTPDSFILRMYGGVGDSFGQPLTVLYKAPFGQFTTLATDTAAVGLDDSMIDLLPMGAALRLLTSREIRRNDLNAVGNSFRAEEVPAGAAAAAPNWLRKQYADRVHEEAARLAQAYPLVRS